MSDPRRIDSGPPAPDLPETQRHWLYAQVHRDTMSGEEDVP